MLYQKSSEEFSSAWFDLPTFRVLTQVRMPQEGEFANQILRSAISQVVNAQVLAKYRKGHTDRLLATGKLNR